MKKIVKEMSKAAAMIAVIIAVHMMLSYAFTYHAAEVFSKTALNILFFYYLLKGVRKCRSAAAAR